MVIRVDRNLDALGKKRSCRVSPQIINITKNLVRNRTGLDADVFIFDLLNEIWVHGEAKAVTNTLRAEKNGII